MIVIDCLFSYNLKLRLLNMKSLFIFPRRSVYPPADRNQAPNGFHTPLRARGLSGVVVQRHPQRLAAGFTVFPRSHGCCIMDPDE